MTLITLWMQRVRETRGNLSVHKKEYSGQVFLNMGLINSLAKRYLEVFGL